MNKKFYTINKHGEEEIRDLEREGQFFSLDGYNNGTFDAYNYQWHENFNNYLYDDLGCDYERYGCVIQEGDIVLDLGANIGVFSHRAEIRGASKVISFEPMSPTFKCLLKNIGDKTIPYKNAVGGTNEFREFSIHSSYDNLGGASSSNQDYNLDVQTKLISEKVFTININDIFETYERKINFMKIDVEGGEVEILESITDDNLSSLRCIAAEFHKTFAEFEEFQKSFIERVQNLGFKTFTLYHGNGFLRTINVWK